jgi:hypothetical protein
MATTFTKIAEVIVGSGGSTSIDFTSIPATYTDLVVKMSTRAATGGPNDVKIMFNSDTNTANYLSVQIQGAGSGTPTSGFGEQQTGTSSGSGDTASTFANSEVYIPNYLVSAAKSYSTDTVTENNGTTAYATLRAGKWSGTAAVTTINFSMNGAVKFAEFSTFYLYGVKNA